MLDLDNRTDWSAGIYEGWSRDRQLQYTTVFKAAYRFDLEGNLQIEKPAPPLCGTDEYFGDPFETGLKAANETVPFKQGGEFYLFGTAHPPGEGKCVTEVGVGLTFPDGHKFRKILRVFGERQWQQVMLNPVIAGPGRLAPTPLRYERAFGGSNPAKPDDVYPLNPIGKGVNGKGWKLANTELPQIEYANNLIKRPSDMPPPAGFGPIPGFWEPRSSEAGEPDLEAAEAGLCPYTEGTEATVHNCAPPDQRFTQPFQGGEVLYLAGFFKELDLKTTVRISIPPLHPYLFTIVQGEARILEPVCDTLIVDTDERLIQLVYRAAIPAQIWDAGTGWVVLEENEQDDSVTTIDGIPMSA